MVTLADWLYALNRKRQRSSASGQTHRKFTNAMANSQFADTFRFNFSVLSSKLLACQPVTVRMRRTAPEEPG